MLMLTDAVVLDDGHDVPRPRRPSTLLGRHVACHPPVLRHRRQLLLSPLLPHRPGGNLLPVVLLEDTTAVARTNRALKSAGSRTAIDWLLAVSRLTHAFIAAVTLLVATAVVQRAVTSVLGRDCRKLTIAPVG